MERAVLLGGLLYIRRFQLDIRNVSIKITASEFGVVSLRIVFFLHLLSDMLLTFLTYRGGAAAPPEVAMFICRRKPPLHAIGGQPDLVSFEI